MGFLRRRKEEPKPKQSQDAVQARLTLEEIRGLAEAKESEDLAHKRIEAYLEPGSQELLRALLEAGRNTQILPTYDPAFGFRYRDAERILGQDKKPEDVIRVLEHLADLDILQRSFFDTIVACPVCNSTLVTTHCRCPKCRKGQVHRSGLIEHIPCGNITDRETYYKGTTVATCPKCGKQLQEGQYRDMGVWYVCKDCGERFEHPEIELACRNCDAKAAIETATVREVWRYSLNPIREQEIRQNVVSLETIRDFLTDEGFNVEPSGTITGERSGIQHTFSLVGRKLYQDEEGVMRTRILTVDHAADDKDISSSPIILYTYKLTEVKIDVPIFIAIPKLSETARKIALANRIIVVQGVPRDKSQLGELKQAIDEKIEQRIKADQALRAELPERIVVTSATIDIEDKKIDVWRDQYGRFHKKPD